MNVRVLLFGCALFTAACLGGPVSSSAEGPKTPPTAMRAEPDFPADLKADLFEALTGPTRFVAPHLDERVAVPPDQSFVWSGASVDGETSIGLFSVRFQPQSEAARAGVEPTELEFALESDSVRVRAAEPVQREYLGGLRFSRDADAVRRIAIRLAGRRELAVFVPAMTSEGGFGLAVCLTALGSKEIASGDGAGKAVDYPTQEPFIVDSGRFTPHAFVEGRSRSGLLPAKARAIISHSANIGAGIQDDYSTSSQDPKIAVTYFPKTPPAFVSAGKPDRIGAAIEGRVDLYTPAGHRQTQTIESAVWVERLVEPLTIPSGGLDMMPRELLPQESPPVGPIYGSCFLVGGRHGRASEYAAPSPENAPSTSAE